MCGCAIACFDYDSDSAIFSDFSPRMFVNVLLFRELLAREMSFILGTAKDIRIFFFILYFVQIGNACTSRWRCWFFKQSL